MKTRQLYSPFEIHVSDLEDWTERALVYHFFEIVQILEGEGARHVNENDFEYKTGSIFLFTPKDCRGFISRTPTKFCSIRFTETFLDQYKGQEIFTRHNRFEQILIHHDGDCNMVSALIQTLIGEYDQKQQYFEENLKHLLTLVLNIISRNIINKDLPVSSTKDQEPLINKMLVYLHQHIADPEKIRVKNLAEKFNLSQNYIGEYFKKSTGDSLHCYITEYKMNMIGQRLTYSEHPIGHIADEFGFTDESHLSRAFKKQKGLTPAQFRKQYKKEKVV